VLRRIAATLFSAAAVLSCAEILGIEEMEAPPAVASDASPGADADGVRDGGADTQGDAGGLVLADGLVAAWSFDDDTSVNVVDLAGNGHVGTLQEGTVFAAAGHRGGCITFSSGTNGFVVDSLMNERFPRTGTLAFWIKHALAGPQSRSRGIFDEHDPERAHLFLRQPGSESTGGTFQYAAQIERADGAPNYAFGGKSITLAHEVWAHVAMTWNEEAGVGEIFVDGSRVHAAPYEHPFAPTAQRMQLGKDFIGSIDEVRLYGRVLSVSEVAILVELP
jgi:hypothetical protein